MADAGANIDVSATHLSNDTLSVTQPGGSSDSVTVTTAGFGFSSTSNFLFTGVAEDGTRSQIVVRPASVPSATQMTVVVPALAVTGAVTVAGADDSFDLQVVPTLTGISHGTLTPGSAIRLSSTDIPEGGDSAFGYHVTYDFGGAVVTDDDPVLGPDAFSALDEVIHVGMNVPSGASGSDVTVTTAGGSSTLHLADVVSASVAAEPQGVGAVDGVGATIATATDLALGTNSLTTVSGRINAANDVDLYHLDSAASGGRLMVSASGAQGGNATLRLFDASGTQLAFNFMALGPLTFASGPAYYLGYSAWSNTSYNINDGSGATNGGPQGDYSLSFRYADPGSTGLNAISSTASSGVPTSATLPSANVGQTITLTGEGFSAATRVRFTTFNAENPNDVEIVLGGATLTDTGAFFGPNVYNGSVGAGLNRADNDEISLALPLGAGAGPFIVRSSGGEATLVAVNSIDALALTGTPANAAIASANAGQTIRILGDGLNFSTDIIFPIVDTNGTLSNRVVRPDFVSTDGTLAEVRVPNDARTGGIQVVGASGTFQLQVVPTLKLVERYRPTDIRMLGGGFTENTNLSVQFSATNVADTGSNIDVYYTNLTNDSLNVAQPACTNELERLPAALLAKVQAEAEQDADDVAEFVRRAAIQCSMKRPKRQAVELSREALQGLGLAFRLQRWERIG